MSDFKLTLSVISSKLFCSPKGCLSVNFLHFHLLQNHCANFNQICQEAYSLWGFKFIQMKGQTLFQGEMIAKLLKYIDNI